MSNIWIKNGKVVLNENGEPILCDECPCPDCVPGASCEHCDDVSPAEYTVLFSSIELCDECFLDDIGGTYNKLAWPSGVGDTLNTSHTLTQASCEWTKDLPGAVNIKGYNVDGTCTSEAFSVEDDIVIRLTRLETEWNLRVEIRDANNSALIGVVFEDTVVANTLGGQQLCSKVPTFYNEYASSIECGDDNGDTEAKYGHSGYGTVTCV